MDQAKWARRAANVETLLIIVFPLAVTWAWQGQFPGSGRTVGLLLAGFLLAVARSVIKVRFSVQKVKRIERALLMHGAHDYHVVTPDEIPAEVLAIFEDASHELYHHQGIAHLGDLEDRTFATITSNHRLLMRVFYAHDDDTTITIAAIPNAWGGYWPAIDCKTRYQSTLIKETTQALQPDARLERPGTMRISVPIEKQLSEVLRTHREDLAEFNEAVDAEGGSRETIAIDNIHHVIAMLRTDDDARANVMRIMEEGFQSPEPRPTGALTPEEYDPFAMDPATPLEDPQDHDPFDDRDLIQDDPMDILLWRPDSDDQVH